MRKIFLIITFGFSIFPNGVLAGELKVIGNFCVPAASIFERAQMCEDNSLFVQHADQCVERLNREVLAATKSLNQAFVKNDGKNQSLNFNSSLQDYNFSSSTLAKLISYNKQALADVTAYYPAVVEPDDMDELEDPEEWAKSVPCYSRTRKSILHVMGVLKAKLENLENAKRIADAHDATSGQRQVNNGVIIGAPASARQTSAQGAGNRVPAGKSVNGASDITGTRKSAEQEAKSKAIIQQQK